MKWLIRLLSFCVLVAGLFLPTQVGQAGEGSYTDGTVDEISLNVVFMYDEPCFATRTCGAWELVFKEASKLLYDATQKQVRIAKVKLFNNCPETNAKADVRVFNDTNGAQAHVGGLGTNSWFIRLSQTHRTVTVGTAAGNRGQFGLAHELGHYAFGLLDEYLDKSGNKVADAYCVDDNGTTATIMDGGTTVNLVNRRTEFCWSGNHRAGHTEQDKKRKIGDTDYENTSGWTWLAAYVRHNYGATLTVPTSDPTSDVSGHTDPTFEYHGCGVRAVTCIDRSGSMSGTPLTLAKSGAKSFVNLTEPRDQLAVTSYSDDVTTNYAMNWMSPTNQTAAKSAIDTIASSATTNIGGGLQQSLNQVTGAGQSVSNEVIVLLSDGQHNTGTHPDAVIPALRARGVTVYTIGLGSADAALMRNIASQTGGNYYYATNAWEMKGHFLQIFNEMRNNGLIERLDGSFGGTHAPQATEDSRTVYVDQFSDEVNFILTWDNPSVNMTLTVIRPNGTTVQAGDPGVSYLYDARNGDKSYRIQSPPVGNWTVVYGNPGTTPVNYSLQVHSAASEVTLGAKTDRDTYTYPQPVLIEAAVTAGEWVGGAQVTAEVVRPNAAPAQMTLYDDGLALHGDVRANDGVYSNYFSDFSGNGSYTFNVLANNVSGYAVSKVEDGGSAATRSLPRFVRRTQITVVVQGQPANQFRRVYLPSVMRMRPSTPGGFDSQFNGSAAGWQAVGGSWSVDSAYLRGSSVAGYSISAAYNQAYANLDYTVRMLRTGCSTCANRLLIRGTPSPLDSRGYWYSYYSFQVTNEGSYSIWKRTDGITVTQVQGWTPSSALNTGEAWNTLRVVANGVNISFYINGSLTWSGAISGLGTGRVGVGIYSDVAGDNLYVDWARLLVLSPLAAELAAPTDVLDPGQSAINELYGFQALGNEDISPPLP